MSAVNVKTRVQATKVKKKADEGTFRSLTHAGGAVRLTAKRSIKYSKKNVPSPPGTPPHTHTRKLPQSILYAVDQQRKSVIIGPSVQKIGKVGKAHEFGGVEYPARTRKPNWRIALGGHGPISNRKGLKKIDRYRVSFIRIRTAKQLERVREFVASLPASIKLTNVPPQKATYPKRPFMRPALERMKKRLPLFWKGAFRGP